MLLDVDEGVNWLVRKRLSNVHLIQIQLDRVMIEIYDGGLHNSNKTYHLNWVYGLGF